MIFVVVIEGKTRLIKLVLDRPKYSQTSNHKDLFQSDMTKLVLIAKVNPLSANPTKWSNTLRQIVGGCRRII